MRIPDIFKGNLTLPIICAPMFLVSSPKLVISACQNGIIGSFPALNTRPQALLDDWLSQIKTELSEYKAAYPEKPVAPFAVNEVVHPSNSRLESDHALVRKHEVPLVITSQGNPADIVKDVHSWGGIVFHDVINTEHAKKALKAGVDGIIVVAAGAGGHGGTTSPFALIKEIRDFWDGPLALAGAINDGQSVRAAEVMGADFSYMGTRFIATQEAQVSDEYKTMLLESTTHDVIYSDYFTGVHANYLRGSLEKLGITEKQLGKEQVDLDLGNTNAWKDVWSAGHGVAGIHDLPRMEALVERLNQEYISALQTPSFEVN